MAIARRFLPPTALLTAFEAAARSQSFTVAARELNLTQSAVSRQIRALEDILGAQLFHREKQKVKLTLAGSAYAREIRDGLSRISSATLSFRATPDGGALHLAVLPMFGARWLLPRLPRFLAAHPDIVVHLTTRSSPFDFRLETLDAAIHFGTPQWPGAQLDFLMSERLVPVCTAAMKQCFAFAKADDLAAAPLLHLVSRPDAWEQWFSALAVEVGEVHGMLVDQFELGVAAARANLGVALLPELLVTPQLEGGELVKAIDVAVVSEGSYYLAWPDTHTLHPPLNAFRQWLACEVSLGKSVRNDQLSSGPPI